MERAEFMKTQDIVFKNKDSFKLSFLDLLRVFMKRLLKPEARGRFL